ncbi:MAG: TnsA endonuclease N-terminal domain-containing protein [Bacteroidales bacterium]|jgi:hypothetical protein|nr:TnsA endonuclease N-terminal domain-containing protein [Bacteroidales bacterium]
MRKKSNFASFCGKKSQKKIIISPKKQRNISLSKISLTGSISSIKNNDSVQFESSLERDFIYLVEFDKKVYRYLEQPFKLFYYQYNSQKYYIPDFYVEFWNGLKQIVEIKYNDDLIANKSIYQKKFNIAEEFCKKNGIEFKILTEKEIRSPKLFNAKFLLSYQNPKYGFNNNDTQIILNVLKQYEQLTVQQLLDISVKSDDKKAEMLYIIWYMVSNYLVYFDNEIQLSTETKLWLPNL